MSKFEEIFDDFLYKAKSVADVAGKKTGEVVGYNKLKYQVKQTQWDIEKAYAKLGAFVYESRKSEEDFTDLIALAISEIDLLGEKQENLEKQILACKKVIKCTSCGRENDLSNSYCSRCGNSLDDEKEEAAAAAAVEEAAEEAEQAETETETETEE